MNKIYFTALFILMTLVSAQAQITGTLVNEDKTPRGGVSVYLSNGLSVQTLNNGNFTFYEVLNGAYSLGTQIGEQTVTLLKFNHVNKTDLGVISVSRNIQLKETVIIGAESFKNIERLPDVKDNIIYAGKKNEVVRLTTANANLAQNNSRQIFAKVPGVQVWESDGSGVQMGIATRGLSPNRMWEFNTRQNGYDIAADPFGYPEAYYTPSVESLDRIEVIRGAASLQFGAQLGGVVNYIKKQSISGKKIGVESMQTFGSYGMFSSFNAIGGNYKNLSYYANINYRRSNGWRDNNQYETINGFVNIGYQISKKLKLQAEYSRMNQLVQQPGGLTDSIFKINPKISLRNRNWFNLNWNLPAVNLDYTINEDNKLNVKVFGLYGVRSSIGNLNSITNPDTVSSTTGQFYNRRIDEDVYKNIGAEARYLFNYKIGKNKNTLASGIRYFYGNTLRYRNNNGNNGTTYDLSIVKNERVIDLNFHSENIALFAENIFYLNQRLSITPGIRAELLNNKVNGNYTLIDKVNNNSSRKFLLLGIGSVYKTSANTNIYANISQGYRPVLFSDFTPGSTTDSIDNNLIDSKGFNADFGFRGSVKNWLNFDASLFYLLYDNRIGTYTINGRNFRTNIGSSISKGAEIYAEVSPTYLTNYTKLGNLNLFAALSFIDATYNKWNNPDLSKNISGKKVENAPEYIHRIGITYSYKTFSISYQTSFVGSAFSDALNTVNATANAQAGLIPAYQVSDVSLSVRIKKTINLNGGVNNLYNNYYFTRRSGGYPGPGLLPAEGRMWYVGLGIKI